MLCTSNITDIRPVTRCVRPRSYLPHIQLLQHRVDRLRRCCIRVFEDTGIRLQVVGSIRTVLPDGLFAEFGQLRFETGVLLLKILQPIRIQQRRVFETVEHPWLGQLLESQLEILTRQDLINAVIEFVPYLVRLYLQDLIDLIRPDQ